MKIDWKRKLSSRKFWAAIIGVIVGLAAAFGIDGNQYTEIAGLVTSAASLLTYIITEGIVDKSSSVPININFTESEEDEK